MNCKNYTNSMSVKFLLTVSPINVILWSIK